MRYTVIDIESDGLLEEATVIHCLSYKIYEDAIETGCGSFTLYKDMADFVLSQKILVGHNIIRYDIPLLEKILRIKVTARLIDTLALSWYLYPNMIKHGLEVWGDLLGVQKPIIDDWVNLGVENYIHRCETDVIINSMLFSKMLTYLMLLYEGNKIKILQLIDYLCYKLDCAREQEEVKCKIDRALVDKSLEELYILQEEKVQNLIEAMPRHIKRVKVSKPAKFYRKDGSVSSIGVKWLNILYELNLPEEYEGDVFIEKVNEPGNPASSQQLKAWLNSLGWEPITFEFRKNKAGDIKQVAQIYDDDGVCESIKRLYDIEPALENLDMLSLINHRISVFNGLLESMNSDDYVKAEVAGLTNTLRFKHKKPIANLPKVFKFYGSQIRGSIIRPTENHILCGSDMSSLEDSTKQHYMYFFDPEYVTQMRIPGFDPHLDIAVLSGMLTAEQVEQHKKKEVDYSEIRGKAKVVNFAGIYGAGPPKIAQTTGMPLEQAQKLHKTYWERNKAVKLVSKACTVKTVDNQMWLLNPISGFWYSLRYEKDIFSTLNQGTGVFCFDIWVREVRRRGIKLMLQYHDEVAFPLIAGEEEQTKVKLNEAIEAVNQRIKLNVPLGISIDFGINYAEIH